MSPRSKREYRETVHLRYKNATRHEKTAILDEFCATCECHRKHAIRVLRRFKRFTKPKPKRRGKPPIYQNEAIINPLKEIWLAANLPCSKRLKVMLPIWLPGYPHRSTHPDQPPVEVVRLNLILDMQNPPWLRDTPISCAASWHTYESKESDDQAHLPLWSASRNSGQVQHLVGSCLVSFMYFRLIVAFLMCL
jgi:hypothetical protein